MDINTQKLISAELELIEIINGGVAALGDEAWSAASSAYFYLGNLLDLVAPER